MVKNNNPATQMTIGRRLGIHQQRISDIIKEDLGSKRLKKPRAKHQTEAIVVKRRKRAKKFKEKISGDQLQFIVTIDEAILPHDHTNGETEYCHAAKNIEERDRSPPLATSAQQFPE